jgi:geranylgeranyl pyrophosphate synthase
MIGGQGMDLFAEGRTLSREQLSKLQALKTGALISAACRLGCIAARVYEGDAYTAAELYAEKIGLAFQVVDDLLDATGSEERLGKPIGSDERSHKVTFYTLLGEEGAQQYAARLTEEAVLAVKALPESQRLIDLAESLLSRDH